MFCNHENITDYCINNFTYSYASLTNDGFYLYPDSGNAAPVIRQDLTTGDIKNISILSTDIVQNCDSNDDSDNITEWNCYQIYRNLGTNPVQDASIEVYRDYQKKLVAAAYADTLDYGINIILDKKIFILPSKIEDIIYYSNLASQVQYLYDSDPDNKMPSFFDKDGNTHTLSYSDLIFVLKIYLNKVIHYKNLIDNINRLIDNVETIDEINDLGWCDDKIISSLVEDTKIEDKEENPPVIPDLPPDSISDIVFCESNSDCSNNQCCINGYCSECADCSGPEDCDSEQACCDGSCVSRVTPDPYVFGTCSPGDPEYAGDVVFGDPSYGVYCCPSDTYWSSLQTSCCPQ